MAGKNKTNAWNSIKFIKSHLPVWQKIGMKKSFLNAMIEPKYKACAIDVETAITCDIMNFETAYNQPDFVAKFKEVCRKHKMPYGKVDLEVSKKAEEFADLILVDFSAERPKRMDTTKETGFRHIEDHWNSMNYKVHSVSNIKDIVLRIKSERTTGEQKLAVNEHTMSLLLSLSRDKSPLNKIHEATHLSEKSIVRYYTMLQRLGYGHLSKNKNTLHTFVLDYDKVIFEDNYRPENNGYVTSLFGD